MQKLLKYSSLPLIIFGIALFVLRTQVHAATYQMPKSMEDMKALVVDAGFTNVSIINQQGGKFQPPEQYFRANETVLNATGWGDIANVINISAGKKFDPSWTFNNGQMQVQDVSGRTKASISTKESYIVVIGSDKDKVVKLISILAQVYP